jgi:hypothetical protein
VPPGAPNTGSTIRSRTSTRLRRPAANPEHTQLTYAGCNPHYAFPRRSRSRGVRQRMPVTDVRAVRQAQSPRPRRFPRHSMD